MRAVVQRRYGGPEVLELETVPRPDPGPDEVLIEVHAAGVDRGTWHLMTGLPYLVRAMFGLRRPKFPLVGLDVAGVVVAVGANVDRLAVGDRVVGIAKGSFAEYAVAEAEKISRCPANLPFEQAGALTVSGITALEAVVDVGQVRDGQRVLVLGASGGVGSYAVQIARAQGARVTGVAGPGAGPFVESLGAERVLDYTRDDFAHGDPAYDVIIDCGGRNPTAKLRSALAPTGTLVIVGGEGGGRLTGGFERSLLAGLRSRFTSQRLTTFIAREHHSMTDRLAELVEQGRVTPAIGATFPLERAADALRRLEAGGMRGKLVLVVERP